MASELLQLEGQTNRDLAMSRDWVATISVSSGRWREMFITM
jgi:hypothetical protein